MFFIDSKTSSEQIINLFHENMKQWGGRYNPIVPVYNNNIDLYKGLIKNYDPDYIYYNSGVDISIIKKLNCFSPKEYIELNERSKFYSFNSGIDYHYILNDKIHGELLRNQKLSILVLNTSYNLHIPAKLFYQTNFNLFHLYAGEDFLIKEYNHIEIKDEDVSRINEFIHKNKPFFKSKLSQLYINTTVTKPKDYSTTSNFEFIIYDNYNSFEDLFYFWNRQLYIDSDNKLNQIIASEDELTTLMKDNFFEGVLYDLAFNSRIDLLSRSILRDKLELIRQDIQSKFRNIMFSLAPERNFPFEIGRVDHKNSYSFSNTNKSAIIGKKDILKLIVPSFNKNIDTKGNYVMDVKIEKEEANHVNIINFPFKTPLHHLVCEQESRINGFHNISLLVSERNSIVDIKMPNSYEIFQSLLSFRNEERNYISTGLEDLQLSNDGKRLSAFLRLFENNLDEVENFIGDTFWLNLFKCESEITSNNRKKQIEKPNIFDEQFWSKLLEHASEKAMKEEKYESNIRRGKGIFSYKDLKRELALLYRKHLGDIKSKSRIAELNEEQFANYIKKMFKDDFEREIDNNLQYLINNDALFIGMKVKCNSCGLNSWYSLNELKNKMLCKGCYAEIIPKLQSELYYRVNEIIVSNLRNNEGSYHGNYIVLRTLLSLNRKSRNSFLYQPPMDVRYFDGTELKTTDIDILAIQDGKLIIGEAKCDASEFKEKEKKALIWMGNNIKPDIIYLAFHNGRIESVEQKISEIKTSITEHCCEVIPYQVKPSKYKFGALFGL